MKLLLINPFLRHWTYQVFPLGLGYVAGAAVEAGHSVEILDINALSLTEQESYSRLAAVDYDVAGIGGLINCYAQAKRLAGFLKSMHPRKPVVVGGALTSGIEKLLLEKTKADFVVKGEGESAIQEFLNAIEKNSGLDRISGLYYRRDGRIVANEPRQPMQMLDNLPAIPYDLFPMQQYLLPRTGDPLGKVSFDIMASRGCPFSCGFCSRISGQRVFYRSVSLVIEEIARHQKEYGVDNFWFLDESFTVDRSWVIQFCNELLSRNLKITFSFATRVNLVDRQLLALLKNAGCTSISFGLESYSRQVLKRMKKGISPEQIDAAIACCQEAGIGLGVTYMFGYPGETLESIYETVKFLSRHSSSFMQDFFVPLPGSEIYEELRNSGKIPDGDAYLEGLPEHFNKPYINVTGLSDFELSMFPLMVFNKLHGKKTLGDTA